MSENARGTAPTKTDYLFYILAMAGIVLASNILVQHPLGDWLTWGAFSYPFAFLVTDLANRRFGVRFARQIVGVGFVFAVALSVYFATPRLAIASGSAFLLAQLLDVAVFNRLRRAAWWRAPLLASISGSVLDTAMFFSLAFAPVFAVLGPGEAFALEPVAQIGNLARWVGWALGDLGVKLAFALFLLIPYRVVVGLFFPPQAVSPA